MSRKKPLKNEFEPGHVPTDFRVRFSAAVGGGVSFSMQRKVAGAWRRATIKDLVACNGVGQDFRLYGIPIFTHEVVATPEQKAVVAIQSDTQRAEAESQQMLAKFQQDLLNAPTEEEFYKTKHNAPPRVTFMAEETRILDEPYGPEYYLSEVE